MSQHRDYRESSFGFSAPHWNELLPGDTFRFIDRTITNGSISFDDATFRFNVVYTVIARRFGRELPRPKDYYVFLGAGMPLVEILL